MIVTANGAGANSYAYCSLMVLVLTGAIEAGGASAAVQASPAQASVTPNASNSLVCFALTNESNSTTFTAAANNTSLNSVSDSGLGTAHMEGYYSGAVVGGTPIIVGSSAPSVSPLDCAVYEVRPSGIATPAQDASTPAAVNVTSASASTASFTPPVGAVLAALVSTPGGFGSGYAMAVSDSTSLTWTSRAQVYLGVNQGFAAVFTATVPGLTPGTVLTGSIAPATVYTASILSQGT